MNELSKDPQTRERTIAHQKREAYLLAKARADSYLQRHPGDGFVHELDTTIGVLHNYPTASHKDRTSEHIIRCPCSQSMGIPVVPRKNRDIQLVQCPACFYWHAITWCVSKSLEALNHFTPRVR